MMQCRELCYLKSHRGPLLTRPASVFTSGATFRDGCVPDPPCAPPYAPALHGSCLLRPALPSSRAEAAAVCETSGGRLVRSYEHGGYGDGEAWHWVDTGDTAHCWACRPARWAEGVASLDCGLNLAYVCQVSSEDQIDCVVLCRISSAARRVPLAPAAAAPDHPGAGALHRAGHQPAGGRHPAAEAEQQDQVQEAAPQEEEEVLCKSILEPYFWIV